MLTIAGWLESLKGRCRTIPPFARYSLKVFGGALGGTFPTSRPTVLAAVACKRKRAVRTDPPLCTEFALALERRAADKEVLASERLYCALFSLRTLTSLRFGDTQQTASITRTSTALCGPGLNNKDRSSDLVNWATPLSGLTGDPEWRKPIVRHWEKIKPTESDKFRSLLPHINAEGRVVYDRDASFGSAQSQLSRIGSDLGFLMG